MALGTESSRPAFSFENTWPAVDRSALGAGGTPSFLPEATGQRQTADAGVGTVRDVGMGNQSSGPMVSSKKKGTYLIGREIHSRG